MFVRPENGRSKNRDATVRYPLWFREHNNKKHTALIKLVTSLAQHRQMRTCVNAFRPYTRTAASN